MNIPRVKFEGDKYTRMVNCIFAETLQDLLDKYEDGRGAFPTRERPPMWSKSMGIMG